MSTVEPAMKAESRLALASIIGIVLVVAALHVTGVSTDETIGEAIAAHMIDIYGPPYWAGNGNQDPNKAIPTIEPTKVDPNSFRKHLSDVMENPVFTSVHGVRFVLPRTPIKALSAFRITAEGFNVRMGRLSIHRSVDPPSGYLFGPDPLSSDVYVEVLLEALCAAGWSENKVLKALEKAQRQFKSLSDQELLEASFLVSSGDLRQATDPESAFEIAVLLLHRAGLISRGNALSIDIRDRTIYILDEQSRNPDTRGWSILCYDRSQALTGAARVLVSGLKEQGLGGDFDIRVLACCLFISGEDLVLWTERNK
jgi:hypothetical protein